MASATAKAEVTPPKHKYCLKRERVPQQKLFHSYSPEYVKLHFRDGNFRAHAPLPALVDLRPKFPPVFAQGDTGSCTTQALVAVYMFDESPGANGEREMLSRLFLYYNERELDGCVDSDEGSTLSCGIKALEQQGVCSEQLWPYDQKKWNVKPTPDCYQNAKEHAVTCSSQVDQNCESMKACLASGQPIALGIQVYESFESDETARNGQVRMPRASERCYGGHAVVCVGYDELRKLFIMRNSWGEKWGDKGYFYLPYQYLTDQNLTSDLWIITKVSEPTIIPPVSGASPPRLKLSMEPEPPAAAQALGLMNKLRFIRGVKVLLRDIPPPDKVTPGTAEAAGKSRNAISVSQSGAQCAATIACQMLAAAADPDARLSADGAPMLSISVNCALWGSPQAMAAAVGDLLAKVRLRVELGACRRGAVPDVVNADLTLKEL